MDDSQVSISLMRYGVIQYIQQSQLKGPNPMNKIYDINSDQLKCNFCTNYFKCTLHFANLQRYALKACPKCITAFSYSLLHPASLQLYKLFLFDTGIALPSPLITELNAARAWLNEARDDLSAKVSQYFEEKILSLMREMDLVKENLLASFEKFGQEYSELLDASDKRMEQLRDIIEKLKSYDGVKIASQRGRLLIKEQGRELLKSTRKSPMHRLEKENIKSINQSNVSKLLKSKICGSSRALGTSSISNSKGLSHSRSNTAFSKSRVSRSIVKSIQLDQTVRAGCSFEEPDRCEVANLLQQRSQFQSYMAREVVKQSNVSLKSDGSRNAVEAVLEMKKRTAHTGQVVELIGGDASRTNFGCYLRSLNNLNEVKTVRMIRCSLVDADMDHLLHLLSQMPEVETLIVTNNRLTELSLQAATTFKERHPASKLSNVYMGNNHIPRWGTQRKQHSQLCIHL